MSFPIRMTTATQLVLAALLAEPHEGVFGFDITRSTGIRSGSLYPILQRLETAGWVTSRWEDADEAQAQRRPRRRYYRLTAEGEREARAQVHRSHVASARLRVAGETP